MYMQLVSENPWSSEKRKKKKEKKKEHFQNSKKQKESLLAYSKLSFYIYRYM